MPGPVLLPKELRYFGFGDKPTDSGGLIINFI